jgi:hypothetical protein
MLLRKGPRRDLFESDSNRLDKIVIHEKEDEEEKEKKKEKLSDLISAFLPFWESFFRGLDFHQRKRVGMEMAT